MPTERSGVNSRGHVWAKCEDRSKTHTVALDCEMVGVGRQNALGWGPSALARVCVV